MNLLNDMDGKTQKQQKKSESSIQRKKNVLKTVSLNYKLDNWLLKKGIINKLIDHNQIKINSAMSAVDYESGDCKKSGSFKQLSSLKPKKKTVKHKHPIQKSLNQSVMESFMLKDEAASKSKSKSKTIRRTSSNESFDLPSFKANNSIKSGNKLYKKYGVMLPSVEEVLQEKKDLEVYKNQLEMFQDINSCNIFPSFPLNNGKKCLNQTVQILDCKHLTLKQISNSLSKNLEYLKDIMYGRIFNDRHERFNDKFKNSLTLSTKDLTYNTSMILFTYDQTEFMITKLQKYLDPEDKLTQYFFQVLLPELCLRIFMETHDMNYEEAVIYLDTRPIAETF